jgi:CubicO group peptidase (beta-lactamase class C family)
MGGLYSNVADMARYVAFQLSAWPARDGADGGPLQRSSVRESHLVAGFGVPGGPAFGVNWILRDDPALGHVVFHNGGTEGYHAAVWMLPERGLGVVALGPATFEIDGIAYRALARIAGSRPGRRRPQPSPPCAPCSMISLDAEAAPASRPPPQPSEAAPR